MWREYALRRMAQPLPTYHDGGSALWIERLGFRKLSNMTCSSKSRFTTSTNFLLRLWYLVLEFWPKTSCFRLPYQCPSSSADCARELFKGSNRLASLLVCTWKKFFGWGVWMFCEWCHEWSSFLAIFAHVTWPRAQLLGQSISLKFSLETRLESESFEPLIDFLTFLVQSYYLK